MFNTKFETIEQAKKLNNLSEKEIVLHLVRYFDNQNYRTNYNERKNKLNQLLKNDPIVKERFEALKAKRG